MKTYFRLLILIVPFLFLGCEEENTLNITSPEGILLTDPGIGVMVINPRNADNPAFNITWTDNGSTSDGTYNIDMATDDLFTDATSVGSTDTNSFTLTQAQVNSVLASINGVPFVSNSVYLRVTSGEEISNAVSFVVVPVQDSPVALTPTDGESFTLLPENQSDIAFTSTWAFLDDANLVITYTVEAALAGTDFAVVESLGSAENTDNLPVTVSQLNNAALNLGVEGEATADLDIRVKSSYTDYDGMFVETYSQTTTITVTTYEILIGLTPWGVVGSGYNAWGGAGPDGQFYTTLVPGVIVAYVSLIEGEIKFRLDNSWDVNYGGTDGNLVQDGDNIQVTTAGDYRITINTNDNTYVMEPYSWGIVGSAYNEWGGAGPDAKFYYDYTSDTFKVGVRLIPGEMKIRFNNAWDLNYGGSGGSLVENGDNIPVADEGHYIISINLNDFTYTFETGNVAGVVGSGFNEWGGAGPDFSLTEVQPNVFVGDIATFVDGEVKFRMNNAWDINYGGSDGTLVQEGDNLAVDAGLYRVRMSLVDNSYALYKIQ